MLNMTQKYVNFNRAVRFGTIFAHTHTHTHTFSRIYFILIE